MLPPLILWNTNRLHPLVKDCSPSPPVTDFEDGNVIPKLCTEAKLSVGSDGFVSDVEGLFMRRGFVESQFPQDDSILGIVLVKADAVGGCEEVVA